MSKIINQILFSIAKSKNTSKIIGKSFELLSSLLPVHRIYENKYVLAFHHPKPACKLHILLVPKKEIRDIAELYKYPEYSNAILQSIEKIKQILQTEDLSIVSNTGKYQEIKQLHFHLYNN